MDELFTSSFLIASMQHVACTKNFETCCRLFKSFVVPPFVGNLFIVRFLFLYDIKSGCCCGMPVGSLSIVVVFFFVTCSLEALVLSIFCLKTLLPLWDFGDFFLQLKMRNSAVFFPKLDASSNYGFQLLLVWKLVVDSELYAVTCRARLVPKHFASVCNFKMLEKSYLRNNEI